MAGFSSDRDRLPYDDVSAKTSATSHVATLGTFLAFGIFISFLPASTTHHVPSDNDAIMQAVLLGTGVGLSIGGIRHGHRWCVPFAVFSLLLYLLGLVFFLPLRRAGLDYAIRFWRDRL